MIVIGSNTSDNGKSRFTEDVSHFMELRQNRQLALLKRSAKNYQGKNVLLEHYIKVWNSLDVVTKSSKTINQFKRLLKDKLLC